MPGPNTQAGCLDFVTLLCLAREFPVVTPIFSASGLLPYLSKRRRASVNASQKAGGRGEQQGTDVQWDAAAQSDPELEFDQRVA